LGIDLPGELASLRDVALHLSGTHPERSAKTPAAVEDDLVQRTITAAANRASLPGAEPLSEARRAVEVAEDATRVHQAAIEEAGHRLRAGLFDAAEGILTGPVRAALEDCLQQARQAAATAAGIASAEAALQAGDKGRKAYVALQDLAVRYAAVRTAQERLRPFLAPVQHDTAGMYVELHNFDEVWPEYRSRRNPPWPEDRTLRLAWLVSSAARPWMPLPAEQDARWMEVHGEAVERQRRNRVAPRPCSASAPSPGRGVNAWSAVAARAWSASEASERVQLPSRRDLAAPRPSGLRVSPQPLARSPAQSEAGRGDGLFW
jgi:hypothetical protein